MATAAAARIVFMDEEAQRATQASFEERSESFNYKIDLEAERRKQLENLAKRGTPEYDASCKVEESCREPPKDLAGALARFGEDLANVENGFTSAEKMEKLGREPTAMTRDMLRF
eukprot:PRCOL_00005425-RA